MAVDEPLDTLFVATQTGISRLDARTGRLLGWTWSSGGEPAVVKHAPVTGRQALPKFGHRDARLHSIQAIESD